MIETFAKTHKDEWTNIFLKGMEHVCYNERSIYGNYYCQLFEFLTNKIPEILGNPSWFNGSWGLKLPSCSPFPRLPVITASESYNHEEIIQGYKRFAENNMTVIEKAKIDVFRRGL